MDALAVWDDVHHEAFWLWITIRDVRVPIPFHDPVIAVERGKDESQILDEYGACWERLKETDGLLVIENTGRWNMNSKRMDIQAAYGNFLITLGGSGRTSAGHWPTSITVQASR